MVAIAACFDGQPVGRGRPGLIAGAQQQKNQAGTQHFAVLQRLSPCSRDPEYPLVWRALSNSLLSV